MLQGGGTSYDGVDMSASRGPPLLYQPRCDLSFRFSGWVDARSGGLNERESTSRQVVAIRVFSPYVSEMIGV